MREQKVEKYLAEKVKANAGLCWKWTSPSVNGVPDRIIITPAGRVIFVELKSDGGKLSAIQQRRIYEMRQRNADVRICKGLLEVQELIAELFPERGDAK